MMAIALEALLVKEYARQYCENLDRKPLVQDVIQIAQVQVSEYYSPSAYNEFIVYDTAIYTSLVWLEDKFDLVPAHLMQSAQSMRFEVIFVCDSDIPWEYDPLREDPFRRKVLEEKTINLLSKLGHPYYFIKGDASTRLKQALYTLKKLGLN